VTTVTRRAHRLLLFGRVKESRGVFANFHQTVVGSQNVGGKLTYKPEIRRAFLCAYKLVCGWRSSLSTACVPVSSGGGGGQEGSGPGRASISTDGLSTPF